MFNTIKNWLFYTDAEMAAIEDRISALKLKANEQERFRRNQMEQVMLRNMFLKRELNKATASTLELEKRVDELQKRIDIILHEVIK
mgnify:CR=1 FL=1